MKKLIAAAGIGAAAVTVGVLAGAGTAGADDGYGNYRYLQGLNNNGIYVLNTDLAINIGHGVCAPASL